VLSGTARVHAGVVSASSDLKFLPMTEEMSETFADDGKNSILRNSRYNGVCRLFAKNHQSGP